MNKSIPASPTFFIKKTAFLALGLLATISFWSCKKSDDNKAATPVYTVPTTYNFTNVDYTNQKILIAMADQLVATINLGNAANTVVTAQKLTDMFNNVNSDFNDSVYNINASGLKLSDYCSAAARADLLGYFDSIGVYSQSAVAAGNGTAGVAVSAAAKKLLLSPNGMFYSQLVKKTLMGGLFAYQIENVYLPDSVSNTNDNATVVAGSGTAMEHHWDEAFGFFGVPVDFPANTSGIKYLGSYCTQVDGGLHSNTTLMNAFLTGRTAISAKDLTTKQQQADLLVATFDRMIAACVVQEMKETDENIEAGDSVGAYGTLSEALGFVRALKYNTSATRVVTDAQIAQLEALFDSANPANPNFYNFIGASVNTTAQMEAKTDAIRQLVGSIYGFAAADLALM